MSAVIEPIYITDTIMKIQSPSKSSCLVLNVMQPESLAINQNLVYNSKDERSASGQKRLKRYQDGRVSIDFG
jgi:hypothetical protein